MSWYKARSGNGQGLVVEEDTGRDVAVTYDEKDAALVAAAPALRLAVMGLLDYRCRRSGKYRKASYRYAEDVLRAAEGDTRTPPAWAFDTGKAFNALWHKRRKEIEGAVAAWTAWERRHLHDDDKPAMPEAARLGYDCAVMIGTINKVAADSPDSVSMLAGMESIPVPDGLDGVCLAAVAPADWPASKREIIEAWGRVAEAFAPNAKPAAEGEG